MILEIDDKLSGEDRRKAIILKQIFYAMEYCGNNRSKASKFLGFTCRWMRLQVDKYPELRHLKGEFINKGHIFYKENIKRWGR